MVPGVLLPDSSIRFRLASPRVRRPVPSPLDPHYVKFRDGWGKWIIDKEQYPGLRWAAGWNGGDWGTYPLAKWDFIDFGVVGPSSPLKREWKFESTPHYKWSWSSSSFPLNKLPGLWKDVTGVYDRYKSSRPAAVWNPYDGSWRELKARQPIPWPGASTRSEASGQGDKRPGIHSPSERTVRGLPRWSDHGEGLPNPLSGVGAGVQLTAGGWVAASAATAGPGATGGRG